MKKNIKRIGIQSLGVAFLLLGLAGLVLPFLQGILFLVIGLLLLSLYSESIRAFVDRQAKRHPKVEHYVGRVEHLLNRMLGAP